MERFNREGRDMRRGPSYSIASCVIETAHRLVATAGHDESVVARRRAGRALLTAEVQGFGPIDPGTRMRRYGQGLEVRLGFYEDQELAAVEDVLDLVSDELSDSIGGWGGAIQIRLQMLERGEGWLGATFDWPEATPHRHLDVLLQPRDLPRGSHAGELCVIGRRLRYRLGVDHADGSPDLFWWTTPQTEYWIDLYLDKDDGPIPLAQWQRPSWADRRRFNNSVGALYRGVHEGTRINIDAIANSPDDWGYVDLERDPIRVLTLGPSSGGQTRADVEMTLRRAGTQLAVTHERVASERGRSPGEPHAEALESLASLRTPKCDVVLLYRGGFSREAPVSSATCHAIVDAAERLAAMGVEVVLGLGHGTSYIHGTAGRHPVVGVFEAVTPTAAANWILTEHVNQRLMNAIPDPGQTGD